MRTCVFYIRKIHVVLYKFIEKTQGNNKLNSRKVIKSIRRLFNEVLDEILILNSKFKWRLWIYSVAVCYILIITTLNIQQKHGVFTIVSYIIIAIFLIGVGEFIHYSKSDFFNNMLLYLVKWSIFIAYPTMLLTLFLENLSRLDIFILVIILLIGYSFLFVKSVIDSFNNYFFQFVNFVIILIFFNLFVIGFTFGAFYLENNHIYNYFTNDEFNILYEANENKEAFNYKVALVIAIKGIEPFFNFPSNSSTFNGEMYFIPILEHLLGNIYLLLIIGFFISYSVGRFIERFK